MFFLHQAPSAIFAIFGRISPFIVFQSLNECMHEMKRWKNISWMLDSTLDVIQDYWIPLHIKPVKKSPQYKKISKIPLCG